MTVDGDETLRIEMHCPVCHRPTVVEHVDLEGFQKMLMGQSALTALPGLSDAERETLLTGYHDACVSTSIARHLPDDVSGAQNW
jgi:hypothetical protein